ncbi:unnamed protein product [Caenorhabditis angaria]|uniref:Uncharacterized protein n=1 Tax=Caenorhabditis angaria TaxID=860376 RepID=A0A9P1N756_9PELO|nr:unnamed protein product [Caenorhabditis angaria]
MGKPKLTPIKQPNPKNDKKSETFSDKIKKNKLKFALLLILVILPFVFLPISIYFTFKDSDVQFVESDMHETSKDVDQRLNDIQNKVPDKIGELEVLYEQQSTGFIEKYQQKLGLEFLQKPGVYEMEEREIKSIFEILNADDLQACDAIARSITKEDFKKVLTDLETSRITLVNNIGNTFTNSKKDWNLKTVEEIAMITKHLITITDLLKFLSKYAEEKAKNPDVKKYEKQKDNWTETNGLNQSLILFFAISVAILYLLLVITRCLFELEKMSTKTYKRLFYFQLAVAIIFEICLLIITILSFSSTGGFKYDCNLSVDFDSGNNNNTWYSFNKEKIDEKKITSVCEKSKINVLDGLNMMINKQVVDKYISSIESATNNVTNPKLENIWNEFEVNMNKLREINEKMKQVENGACINKIVKKQLSSKRKPLETLITNTNNLLTAVKEIGVKWKDETTSMKQDLKSSGEKLKKLSLSLFASLNAILEESDISCSSFNGNADEFCGITVQKTSTTYPFAYIFLILLFIILIISCIWLNFDFIRKRKKDSAKKDEKPKEKKNIEKASRIEYTDQTGKTCFFPLTTEVLKQHEIYKAELKKEEKKQRREIKKMVAQPNIRMKSEYNAEDLEKLFGGRNEEPKKDEVLEKVVYEPSLNVLLNFDEDHVDIEPTSNHSVSRSSNYSRSTTATTEKTRTNEK